MNRKTISILLSAVIVVSLAGCGKKDTTQTPVETTAPSTNVTVMQAGLSTITNTVSYTGEVKPTNEVAVSSKLSGKAKTVHVDMGSYVNTGDVLFTIEDTDYQLQLNQAQATYNNAQAAYNSAVGGTQKQSITQVEQALTAAKLELSSAEQALTREKELAENNSNVLLAENKYSDAKTAYDRAVSLDTDDSAMISAKNALTNAESNLQRMQALFDAGATSQISLDDAKTAVENARAAVQIQEANKAASLEAAKSALVQAEENLRTTKINANAAYEAAETRYKNASEGLNVAQKNYDLTVNVLNPERQASAEAQLKSAKAALDIAKNTLENTVVRAPIAGYVTAKNVAAGQMIQAGSPTVTLINMSSMDVEINVTEAVVSGIHQGSPAKISVSSAGITDMTGSVAAISPSKDEKTGMFTVKINVPNSNNVLKGGMFADVSIVISEIANVLSVPADAVLSDNDKSYVYIENNGKAEKREIVTGVSDNINTEITSGITEGETVIVKGKEYITDEKNTVNIVTE